MEVEMRSSILICAVLALAPAAARAADTPTDPQIAHIAYTAGDLDIKAAQLALEKSQDKDVVALRQRHGERPHGRERPGACAGQEA